MSIIINNYDQSKIDMMINWSLYLYLNGKVLYGDHYHIEFTYILTASSLFKSQGHAFNDRTYTFEPTHSTLQVQPYMCI